MRLLAADFPEPGTDLAEEGRFSPDGTAVYLRTSAGRERAALGVVPLLPDGRPGRMRILAARDDADLESYAILRGAPTEAGSASSGGDLEALLVWNVCGVSEIEMAVLPAAGADLPHTAETSRRVRYRVDIGDRVIPGWSIPGDSRSGILELTEPVAPRSLYHVDLFHPGEPEGSRRSRGGSPGSLFRSSIRGGWSSRTRSPTGRWTGWPCRDCCIGPTASPSRDRPSCCCTAARKARSGRRSPS